MRSTSHPKKRRRIVPLVFGLSLAAAALRLTACFVSPNPTNPHETEDGDPSGDPPDASLDVDAAEDGP